MSGPVPNHEPEQIEISSQDRPRAILDIHLAEYAMVTMRSTYWITLHYVTYSITALLVGYIVQAWGVKELRDNASPFLLFSGGLFVLQLLVWLWLYVTWEIFNNAVYLEKRLKPTIEALLKHNAFWGYEPHLAEVRKNWFVRFEWRYGLIGLVVSFFGIVIWPFLATNGIGFDGSGWQFTWLAVNAYLMIIVAGRLWMVLTVQKKLS